MTSKVDAFIEMLKRRWAVALIVFAIGLGVLITAAKIIPTYKANADLLIVSDAMKDTTLSGPDLPSIITSTEVLGHVIDRLHLDTDPSELAKNVSTMLPAKSRILELTCTDRDPAQAARIANEIADQATVYFHQIATRGYTDVVAALDARVHQSQRKIAVADKALQQAANANFAAGSSKALDDLTSQIGELRAQKGQIDATLAADRARAMSLLRELHDTDPSLHGGVAEKDVANQLLDPTATLEQSLAKDVEQLISAFASFHDSSAGLADLERRVKSERDQLRALQALAIANGTGSNPSHMQTVFEGAHAAGLVGADEHRLEASNAQLLAEQKYLQRVAVAGAAVDSLRAKRDGAVQQYITLTQRLSSAQADAARGESLGRLVVVSRATPGRADLPLAIMAGIFIVVLGLALAAAYICDAFDKRLWGVREIENAYGRKVFMELGGRS